MHPEGFPFLICDSRIQVGSATDIVGLPQRGNMSIAFRSPFKLGAPSERNVGSHCFTDRSTFHS